MTTLVPTNMLGAGAVLQVVCSSSSAITTTSSTTYITTGISATITPKFSTSKILVIVSGTIDSQVTQIQGYLTVYRNGSNIFTADGFGTIYTGANRLISSLTNSNLDSPATTSATTYTVYLKTSGGVVAINTNGTTTITLLEIAQ